MMFLAGIMVVALAIRLLSWPAVLTDSGVLFLESDAIYHMRRVALAVAHGLKLEPYDAYLNYPAGFHCNWPNLFDQTIAAIALLLGRGQPTPELVDRVGAFFPPIVGMLTCIPVYISARAFVAHGYALAAAAAFALMPHHIQLSVLGRPDHHVAVVFFAATLTAVAVWIPMLATRRATVAASLLLGILLHLALMTWVGAILFVFILMAHGAISQLLASGEGRRLQRATIAASLPPLLAAVFIAPTALTSYWARNGILAWEALSAFHVITLVCGGIGLLIFGQAARWLHANRHRRIRLVMTLVTIAVALGLGIQLAAGTPFGARFTEAMGWMGKVDPLFRYCVESAPLSLVAARENFTWLVFAFPLLLGWLLFRAQSYERKSQAWLFVVWTLAFGAAAIRQERFCDVLSLFAATLIAIFIAGCVRLGRISLMVLTLRTRGWHFIPLVSLGLVLFFILAGPTLGWIDRYARSAPRYSLESAYELGRWFAAHTEPTAGYLDNSITPEYGVLAGWDFGHVLSAIARRPNIANNFIGWHENREANLAPYRFFASRNPAEAMALLDHYRVRYVIVREPLHSGELPRVVDVLGLDAGEFFVQRPGAAGAKPVFDLTPAAYETLLMRLYLNDGAGLPTFTRVFQSSETVDAGGTPMSQFKVFRYNPLASESN